jgi:ABC-type dipeptide/oligopeptide/nickel transport system permease subunit
MIYSSQVYSGVLGEAIEWNVLIPPSLALSLFAASFYLLARGLHEVADPKIRKR